MTFDAGAIEARLILNRQQFQADLAAARAEGDAFDGKTFEAIARVNTDQVKDAFAKIEAEWQALRAQLGRSTPLNVDNGEVLAKIAAAEAAYEALRSAMEQGINIRSDTHAAADLAKSLASSGPVEQQLTLNPDQAYAALQDLQDRYLELRVLVESGMTLELRTDAFDSAITEAIDAVNRLRDRAEQSIELDVDNSHALLAIADTSAAYNTLKATMSSSIGLGLASGAGAAVTSAAVGPPGGGGGGAGIAAAGAAAGGAAANVQTFTNGMRGLNTQFRLFGGVLPGFLGTIGAIHLIAEAVIELTGTMLPATIAFAAFGAAAVPTVTDLVSRMGTLHTVTQAFGVTLYPLTGGFSAVANAVQPEVYTLFGEALGIASAKTGTFSQLATSAGRVLDELGARFTNAITSSNTFNTIVGHASQDLAGWGNLIGNIGGIVGNVLKVLPGYAEILLNVLQSVSHALEVLTGSPFGQWLLGVGLAAHGALVWIGLLGTAFAVLASRGLAALAPLLLNVAAGLERVAIIGPVASEAMLGMAGAAETAAGLPWGWISLAVAGLGFLIYRMVTAKDAIQQMNAAVQQGLQNAPLTGLTNALSSAYSIAAANLDKAKASLQQFTGQNSTALAAQRDMEVGMIHAGSASTQLIQKYTGLSQNVSDYSAGLQQVKTDQQTVNDHMQQAGTLFGGVSNAWGLMNAAGITSAQVLDTNKSHWAEVIIELQSYNRALLATTQSAGRYGAAQNALNFQAGDQANQLGQLDQSMTKVTQAEDQLFNVLLGGEQTFTSFQQTIQGTLSAQGQLTGGLAQAAKVAGASLSGLNAQSIALAQTYYGSALPAAQKQIDALQMQAISTHDLTNVVATMAQTLLQYAGNNTAAQTSVVALINNALGPNVTTLQNVNKWTKTNAVSLSGYKSIIDKTQVAATQLGGVLQQDVVQMMAAATAAAYGGQQAFTTFATALTNGQTQGAAFTKSGTSVIQTLLTSTGNADAAHRQFDAFAGSLGFSTAQADSLWTMLSHQLLVETASKAGETQTAFEALASQLGTTKGDADKLWDSLSKIASGSPYNAVLTEIGSGTFSITEAQNGGVPIGGGNRITVNAASGLYVQSGAGPTADDNLVAVSRGELIVPTSIVNSGAVDHLRGMIPGFALGGYMASGLPNLGSATSQNWANFQQDVTSAMETAMTQATKAAMAAAVSSAGAGPGGPVEAVLKSLAAGRGWTGNEWTALNNIEMREAGYSLTATNPGSGAYGIAQFINGPSEYYQYGGNPNTSQGQAIAMLNYIAQRYGDPIAAWNHELAYGWYDQGGFLPPGLTLAYNGTGSPEPVGGNSTFGSVLDRLTEISGSLSELITRRPPVFVPPPNVGSGGGVATSGGAIVPPYGYLSGGNSSVYGGFVGDYTGVVLPGSGGFGLTATQLGLPPQSTSTGGSAGGDTGGSTGDTGTGSTTPSSGGAVIKHRAAVNVAKQSAISVLRHLMGGYIWHNELGQARQANALLNWLGDGQYNAQLSEIGQLDTLLLRYRKNKKQHAAEVATEHVLSSFGVHVFNPQLTAKGNQPKSDVIKKLESLMHGDISTNNMTAAGEANALLTHLGVNRYTTELGQIRNLDSLLAKFKKAKNAGEIQAVETLLRQYGVRKFDLGGAWPNMSLGVNTSGRTETVVTGGGMDQLVSHLEKLIHVANAQLAATRAQPHATASRLSTALTSTPLTGAGLARRYPNNR